MSKRKHYDQEFKLNAVKYYLDNENSSVDERAEHLGVSRSTLLKWVNQYEQTGGVGVGTGHYASQKDKEIAELKRELRDVRAANNVLKKAIRILWE
ncbi:transposase [Limosilactobacillus fermentum]|uniref:transposase n=1 Tax=Limosilactobacillus fermentum TaxID=1613 RepID=UPI002091A5AB|nr:transposase [Limosilactobacillus fermentum]UVF14009.1 transposase [Limosilactobacillus fermentum]